MASSPATRQPTCCISARASALGVSAAGRGPYRFVLVLVLLLGLAPTAARSHDPSAWGGVFRSRDAGATWVSANRGAFLSGALAMAISPTDPNHMLLGTESGLVESTNGGRDWNIEAPNLLLGAVFAATFDADGQRALAATGSGLFAKQSGAWNRISAPEAALPARAIMRGSQTQRVYLAGWTGFYRSDDWGASWTAAAAGLPPGPVTALLVTQSPETLYAVVHGGLWVSADGARRWARHEANSFGAAIDSLAPDSNDPEALWGAAGGRLFRSNDKGASWEQIGRKLPAPGITVNGLNANGSTIVLSTDRGLYRTTDAGKNWTLLAANLPAHLEAGPILRDPDDPETLYAGFSLIPYRELWRRAANHEGALDRVSITSLAGGGVVILMLLSAAVFAFRRLRRYYQPRGGNIPRAQAAADYRLKNRRLT